MPDKQERFTVGNREFSLEYYDEGDYYSVEVWEEVDPKPGMPALYMYAADFMTEAEALAHFYQILSDPIRYI